jgi:hypothetical protein
MMQDDVFLIGLEKIAKADSKYSYKMEEEFIRPLGSHSCVDVNQAMAEWLDKEYCQHFNNPRQLTITQFVEFQNGPIFLYNAYEQGFYGNYSFQRGLESLKTLEDRLVDRLTRQDANYTHVIVSSMGWNNDQHEAIAHYNAIINNLKGIQHEFKPLVVVITWPSAWFTKNSNVIVKGFGHLASYPNKANDADEIGYFYMNLIINSILPNVRTKVSQHNMEVPMMVGIGHSFGARVMSRAIFSESHLVNGSAEKGLDLFISLMGAYSARRFNGSSGEGSPYEGYRCIDTKLVLVSSLKDKSNALAFWSKHVGGRNGTKYMAKTKNQDTFVQVKWLSGKNLETINADLLEYLQLPGNQRVLSVDATSIVDEYVDKTENGSRKVSAHNDIDDEDMADLIKFVMDHANIENSLPAECAANYASRESVLLKE